jgi:hypothetical protein
VQVSLEIIRNEEYINKNGPKDPEEKLNILS